jgi:drug/metabolite transporter (DMT)-like permease
LAAWEHQNDEPDAARWCESLMTGNRVAIRVFVPAPWGMAIGALCVSASAVFIRVSGTSPGTASFYRCLLALPILIALAQRERRRANSLTWRGHGLAIVAGVLFAGDMLLWTQSIIEVGAGLSTVLVNLQVVLMPVLAWLVDRERAPRRFLLAVILALLGVVLVTGLLEEGVSGDLAWGTVHGTLAAVCYTGFLFLLR